MCTGFEWFTIGAGALGAADKITQGGQAKDFADYQAAQLNADAQAEREMGIVRAGQVRKTAARTRSEARAAYAGSGVDVSVGSALRTDQQIGQDAEMDALNEILYGSRKGERLDQEAALKRIAGSNAKAEGFMGAAGSILSAGASLTKPGWKHTQAPAPVYDATPDGIVRIS